MKMNPSGNSWRKAALVLSLLLICLFLPLHGATIEKRDVYSDAMKKNIPVNVILPDSSKTDATKRYPVVYLLHGAGGNYRNWSVDARDLLKEVDKNDFIVVCPNAENSWYIDSPVDDSCRYSTFCGKELIAWIDNHYRTIPNRENRAVCGLSMGGYGAMYLAINHLDTFSIAVSLSGGLDIRPYNSWNLPNILGDRKEHPENWEKYTIINQIDKLKNRDLAISIDCGTEDFFLEVNRAARKKLLERKIEHDYCERPGNHSWDYWNNAFPYAAIFMNKHFTRSLDSSENR